VIFDGLLSLPQCLTSLRYKNTPKSSCDFQMRGIFWKALWREQKKRIRRVRLASIDSTGFESHHVSQHFLHRKSQSGTPVFARFHAKLTVTCDCSTHLILAIGTSRGPFPDSRGIRELMKNQITKVDTLLADAGFDSEDNHQFLRTSCGVRSIIPPRIGRPTLKPPTGYYRRQMRAYFKRYGSTTYGQRWQVETVFSMIKRNFGSSLSARSTHGRYRELALRAICHNVAINA